MWIVLRSRPIRATSFPRKFLWPLLATSSPRSTPLAVARACSANPIPSSSSRALPDISRYHLGSSELPPDFLSRCADIPLAVRAVRTACASTILAGDRFSTKGDGSAVTAADYAAQAVVLGMLERYGTTSAAYAAEESSEELRRAPGMLSGVASLVADVWPQFCADDAEEAVCHAIDLGTRHGVGDRAFWVLDPVDGTDGYVSGGQYCVALALIASTGEASHAVVEVGILGCPRLPSGRLDGDGGGAGCVLVAARGLGCYQLPLFGGDGAPAAVRLRVREMPSAPSDGGVSLRPCAGENASRSDERGAFGRALRSQLRPKYDPSPPIRVTSQVKYALLARSECDVFAKLPHEDYREYMWDHAAGALIVEEAGGKVTDGKGHKLEFDGDDGKMNSSNWGIVASCGGEVHEDIAEAIDNALGES